MELNEGLEVLGTDEYSASNKAYFGVFEGSAVTEVKLPSTLQRIEYSAFSDCKNLTELTLPNNLEKIGT